MPHQYKRRQAFQRQNINAERQQENRPYHYRRHRTSSPARAKFQWQDVNAERWLAADMNGTLRIGSLSTLLLLDWVVGD